MQSGHALSGTLLALALVLGPLNVQAQGASAAQVARGKYMVLTGHCNNCHTPGYAQKEGKVPEKEWLLGSGPLGWRGPWGTTYASNLRVYVHAMTAGEWVLYMKTTEWRPPMPWWDIRAMSEDDLRAMYHYIKQLGPAGRPAQPYLPPGKEPKPPYIQYPMPPK